MKQHTKEAVALVAYFILITAFVLYLQPGKVLGHFLYFFVPSIFLITRHWKREKHVILFTTLTAVAVGLVLETVSHLNGNWKYEPDFPLIQLGEMPMEAILWYAMWIGLTVTIYRTFFDPHRHRIAKHHRPFYHHKYFLLVLFSIITTYFVILSYRPELFITDYSYAKFGGLIIVIPLFYLLHKHPDFIPRIFKFTLAMFSFTLVYEIVGMRVGWWTYGGNFLYQFNIFSNSISIEELVLWVILGAAFVASFYEEYETDLR